jgi:hypothetical protein
MYQCCVQTRPLAVLNSNDSLLTSQQQTDQYTVNMNMHIDGKMRCRSLQTKYEIEM